MEDVPGELLEVACARIKDLERPAYIKNSELRYVVVNDAYARLFGREAERFTGLRTSELGSGSSEWNLEENERRALVFGTEEAAACNGNAPDERFVVAVERFLPDDEHAFVLGLFAQLPEPETDGETAIDGPVFADHLVSEDIHVIRMALENTAHPVGVFAEDGRPLVVNAAYRRNERAGLSGMMPPSAAGIADGIVADDVSLQLEQALGLLDVGVSIFDDNDRLLYRNERQQAFYGAMLGEMHPGMPLRVALERIFDHTAVHYPDIAATRMPSREVWVESRLANCQKPFHEDVVELADGRWLRCINRRLESGVLIALRVDVTEFKEQERQLVRHIDEALLYRSVLEELPVATFVRDRNHRLTFVNQAYADLMGMSREEMLNKTETEVFGERGETFHRQNDNVLDSGIVIQKDEQLLRSDDQPVQVITRVARVESGGAERFLVGSLTDITMLKERERDLLLSQKEAETLHRDLDSILRSLPVGVLILGPDFDIEFANAAFYDIWDWPLEKRLEKSHFRDFVRVSFDKGWYLGYGDDFEAAYNRRLNELKTSYAVEQHEVHLPTDKTLIITSKQLSDGKTLVSYVDISAMREQERQINEARQELERVGQVIQDATRVMAQGLLVVENGEIVLSNDATAKILHVPPTLTAPGKRWSAIFDHCAERGDFGDNPESLRRAWDENIQQHRPISAAFMTAGTTWVQLEVTFSDGGHWMVVLNDLTEMKQREEELRRLLARSEAADRAKSEFLANMSHEIRTPMNGVLGMAELLAKTDLDTRQKTFIEIIGKSGNALLTIINDILDFSKIDAGQMKLKKAPFDPVEAVEDVAALLSSAASEKDIELMVRSGAQVPQMVVGDAGRFRQIVTNLVGNAVKFTEKGHILIDIAAVPDGADGVMLSLRVEDTGIGIPPEKLEAIFEKFSQVDSSSTRRHEGTGLGLAITAGLVDLFGGYIDVTSDIGHGSIFTAHLPMTAGVRRDTGRGIPVNVKGARILVIDDNEVNRRILTEQLDMWGFDGFAAESGQAGIDILYGALDLGLTIDAIVLDYQMPDVNGADVAKYIRQDARFDDVSIIFLTSMDVVGDESVFTALRIQAHLMKPARANVLRNTIVDVVRSSRIRRISHAVETRLEPAAEPAGHGPTPSSHRMSEAPMPVTSASRQPSDETRSCDVLVAEDNEVNCIVFSQILQATDLRFMIVNNGQQAVDAWETYKPAIILMDVSMPVMNGHQATKLIREREAAEGKIRVPIIGVTAHALDADRELCLQSGMDDYLSKPISPEMLEEKIDRWLRRPAGLPGDASGSKP
ncbi:response regulator [Rhizobium sp. LjRoot30]|uniref:response regulator n=1 Tax=Rhizobium sp. LjRoot30 TaxID=3342320 RepID=UPI003F503E6B